MFLPYAGRGLYAMQALRQHNPGINPERTALRRAIAPRRVAWYVGATHALRLRHRGMACHASTQGVSTGGGVCQGRSPCMFKQSMFAVGSPVVGTAHPAGLGLPLIRVFSTPWPPFLGNREKRTGGHPQTPGGTSPCTLFFIPWLRHEG